MFQQVLVFQTPTRMVLSSAYITLGCSSLYFQTPAHSSHTISQNLMPTLSSLVTAVLLPKIFYPLFLPCSGRISDSGNVREGPLAFSYVYSLWQGRHAQVAHFLTKGWVLVADHITGDQKAERTPHRSEGLSTAFKVHLLKVPQLPQLAPPFRELGSI